jgi:uncharacterized repeat protein (TIGR02543 family)
VPQSPIRFDHAFQGWFLDQEGTFPWNFDTQIVTGNFTLYAKWSPITVEAPVAEPGQTHRETFASLTQSSSSYTTFSYSGIQSTSWQIAGARGDQTLDGKAITLAGLIDQSKIAVTLTSGLNRLSFQVVKAFTNTYDRKLEIRLNGVSYGLFVVDASSTTAQTITLDNLGLLGTVTVEIVHATGAEARAQIIIDNIEWTTYTGSTLPIEARRLALDKAALALPTVFETQMRWILPSFSTYGSQITWQYTNPSSPDNVWIDLTTGSFFVPALGVKTVQLTATLTNGIHTDQVPFSIRLGIAEPISLSEAAASQNGASIRIRGIIASMVADIDLVVLHLDDGVSGLRVVLPLSLSQGLQIGDEVLIKGSKQTQNNMPYLTQVVSLEVLGQNTPPTPTPIQHPQQLTAYLGRSIFVEGLLAQNVSLHATNASIATIHGLFAVKWSFAVLSELFASSIAGAKVTLVGTVYLNQTNHYLLITDVQTVTAESSVDTTAASAILQAWFVVDLPVTTSSNLVLPSAANLPFSAQVDWISSQPDVIAANGSVTRQSTDVTVSLTYRIRLGATILVSESVHVKVLASTGYTGYYASLSGLSGTALKTELARIISTGVKSLSYSSTSYILDETDVDPAKPGNILLVYNRASVSGVWDGATTWNKEHVWPQSKLGAASDSDLHNLKPSNPQINSNRGNLPFVAGSGTYGTRSGGWFPGEADKGDIARIVFYMNTRWGLAINSEIGSLAVFIQWHNADPVDDFERNRNQVIFANQNNRNPYIDHPELVALVYGTSSQSDVPTGLIVWMVRFEPVLADFKQLQTWAEPSIPLA